MVAESFQSEIDKGLGDIYARIARVTISVIDRPLMTSDAELEVEVTDVEREVEPAEMMDDQRSEDEKQDRHEDPKQPPK